MYDYFICDSCKKLISVEFKNIVKVARTASKDSCKNWRFYLLYEVICDECVTKADSGGKVPECNADTKN